jgi:DNA-binding transcriptional MerR regulator
VIKFLGGGKKNPEKSNMGSGKGFIPVDKAKNMSSKGFTEPEIIDALRREGFSSREIDSALTQSLKLGVTGEDAGGFGGPMPTLQEIQRQGGAPPQAMMPFEEPPPMMQPAMQPQAQMQQNPDYYQVPDYSTEELVESIVHEKMDQMDERLIDFKERYTEMDRRMSDLHNQLSIMSKTRTESEERILNKLDSFKDEISDINAKMSSLEKAFKEALPALIESVRSLTDLVQRIKRETA